MRKFRALIGAILLSGVPVSSVYAQSRQALWTVVQACLLAHRACDTPLPCRKLETESGYTAAVLEPPFDKTHTLVVPTDRVSGIESPALQGQAGAAYARIAWRTAMQATAGSWDQAAFVVNSPIARSQDQLHIHEDCLSDKGRAARDHWLLTATSHWTRIGPNWMMLLEPEDLTPGNPFRLARALPGPAGLSNLAVVGAPRGATGRHRVLILVNGQHSYEWLLRSKCQG